MTRADTERRVAQLELAVISAWRGAVFNAGASVGKLPELKDVIGGEKKRGGADEAFTTAEARRWEEITKAKVVTRG